MAKNYDNVRIYGDLDSGVWVAPLGTTLPTVLGDPPSPFDELGWLTEEGISQALSVNVERYRAYQGGTLLRTKVTSTDKTITVQAVEEKPLVTEMVHGHGAPTITGVAPNEIAKIDLPDSVPTVARAAVFRFLDEDVEKLLCCERVEVGDRGEIGHTNNGLTIYEMSLDIIGASYILTNNPAYTAA